MNTQSQKIRNDRGVSLVELLVVIVLIAILAAFAMMQRGSANEQLQRQNVARELKVALERARFDSVRRRATTAGTQAQVSVSPTAYTVTTYFSDGVTANTVTRDIAFQNIVIDSTLTVYFNQRGEVVDGSGVSISPVFNVCNVSCSSMTAANSNVVLITPTGTVNLLAGGSSIPTFSAPPVTNVPVTTGISNTVVIP